MTIAANAAAVLRTAPGNLKRWAGKRCTVLDKYPARGATFCRIRVDDGSEHGVELRDIPLPYLVPAPEKSDRRRPPLRLHVVKDTRSEAERQKEGVEWLRDLGYDVLLIGQGRKGVKCECCGHFFYPRGYIGNDPGVPDTEVTHTRWGVGAALLMEWKDGPKARRKPEQAELEARGRIVVVWDLPTCAARVYAFETEVLGIEPLPEVAANLGRHRGYDDLR